MTQRPRKKTKRHAGGKRSRPAKVEAKETLVARDENDASVATTAAPVFGGIWNSRLVLLLIVVAAYFLRTIALDMKPPHFDEGINGFFVAKLWKEGYYHYDPTNFHGPLYFYFLQFAELVFGQSLYGFRYVTGLISLGCVGLTLAHRRFFGSAAVIAALIAATGAGFVFYSRYAIHESLFIFFQLLFSYGFYLWLDTRSRRSVAFMVVGVFGAFTVKETFFLFFGTWAIALIALRIAARIWPARFRLPAAPELDEPVDDDEAGENLASFWARRATWNDTLVFVCYASLFAIALFTGFFLNSSGFADMFAAFTAWTKTGVGNSGHEKPFPYWLELLWRYEWTGLVALACSLPLALWASYRERVLLLTTFGTWLAYSIIPYKTPWLIINLLWPATFAFGFLYQRIALLRSLRLRLLARLAAFIAIGVGLATSLRLNFRDFANEHEAYVYVQSTEQMKRALDYVAERVRQRPEDRNMKVMLMVRDPWPLPWVFNQYPGLTYGKPESADLSDAKVIFIDGRVREVLEPRLTGNYWRLPFKIRDSYDDGYAYLDFESFRGIVPSDTFVFEATAPTPAQPDAAAGKEPENGEEAK